MDRNSLLFIVVVFAIMVVWTVFFPPAQGDESAIASADSLVTEQVIPEEEEIVNEVPSRIQGSNEVAAVSDSAFALVQNGPGRDIVVRTNYYEATFSTKGATLTSLVLNDFKEFDQETPIQLVDLEQNGALALAFYSRSNQSVDTRSLVFNSDVNGSINATDSEKSLSFRVDIAGGSIIQTYTFKPDSYQIGLKVQQLNPQNFSTSDGYELSWNGGLPFSESVRETSKMVTAAYVRSGGEVESITLNKETVESKRISGSVEWVALKNTFFTIAMIPDKDIEGAELEGFAIDPENPENAWEDYTVRLLMPMADQEGDEFILYAGPIDLYEVKEIGLDLYDIVDYGFGESITRPISKYIIIPTFRALRTFIPNYGWVIIIFSILIKMVLFPLTKSSYKSMAKMRLLQPQMAEIKEKYTDDAQKQQAATMKLYKSSGVNPLGGCLPMFFQMPILYALFRFFPSAIEIRQQGFLWSTDLSAPDSIYDLPFEIPFYGAHVSGFVLLMCLSMVFQMKMQNTGGTGAQANQMKMMMYFMPVILLVVFNRFAAGLSLYYLMYNLLTAIQQKFINKSISAEAEAAPIVTSKGKSTGKSAKVKRKKKK